jgi:hypothetical protein
VNFERYTEGAVRGRRYSEKRAILTTQGILTFNRAAITELGLDKVTHLALHYAAEEGVLGLEPVDEQADGTRKISISKSGANLSMRAFLTRYALGVDTPQRYEPVLSEEHGMILVDLRAPVDIDAPADGPD